MKIWHFSANQIVRTMQSSSETFSYSLNCHFLYLVYRVTHMWPIIRFPLISQAVRDMSLMRFHDIILTYTRDCRGRDHMVVGFTTTFALSAYHHWCCEFESRSERGVQHCDKVCQWLSLTCGRSVASSTNKTDRHDITEILMKVALNTIKQTTALPIQL